MRLKTFLPGAAVLMLGVAAGFADFRLVKEGEFYSIESDNAPLREILAEIDRLEPASLRFFGDQDGEVSVKFHEQTLAQLLYRLDVSYVLVYETDASGTSRLDDAMLLGEGEDGLSPEARTRILKLIRDLHDDDIRGNAHSAVYALTREGCAAVPLLEKTLYADDYQARHLAAWVLRQVCPDQPPSDKMLEVTLDLLRREGYNRDEYWSLFGPADAFYYLDNHPERYYRIRGRLLKNLQSRDRQERLLSTLLIAGQGEAYLAETLVGIMAPHLADNDMRTDAAAVTRAMYKLGPSVLPYLRPYVNSPDQQQAELAELIVTALETGKIPRFEPEMYVGYIRNPVEEDIWVNPAWWTPDKFPDEFGVYHNLHEVRYTVDDYYGRGGWSEPFVHVVGPGETLEDIARAYAVHADRLVAENPNIDFGNLAAGTELLMPVD